MLFKNKYRIESTRLKTWDYRSAGIYFITICTHSGVPYFGLVKDNQMHLTVIGNIAKTLVYEISTHATRATVDRFVVMPNHIHLLMSLASPQTDISGRGDVACYVSTNADGTPAKTMSAISPKSGSVSSIIRSYKSAVTQGANTQNIPFSWQPGFHDHIVRDEPAYLRISQYIEENPIRWDEDSLNPSHPDFRFSPQ